MQSIDLRRQADISSASTEDTRCFCSSWLGTAGVFFLAGATQNSGWWWSYELCQHGAIFCEHPIWLLIAAVILILLEMVRTMTEA